MSISRVVLIDNYDSFTYNLVQYLGELGAEVLVHRHDAIDVAGIAELRPSHLVISPGPKTPDEAGISVEAIRGLAGTVPILGVCLGHQAIGQAFGGRVVRGREPVHGKTSQIHHDGRTVFSGLDNPTVATRYHSLVVDPDLAPDLELTAWCEGDVVMGVRHRHLPVEGVQFHPESILSGSGKALLANFLTLRAGGYVPSPLISEAIDRLLAGEDLGQAGASGVLELIMNGEAGDAQTAAFLIALRAKGETAEELAGLAATVRSHAEPVTPPSGPFIDTCGTGGGRSTFNISTTATFVVAGAGVAVAKHGNRSSTSKSGSADVLEALGARIDLDPDAVARCIEETGLGYMFAPSHHPAFRHIVPVRRALGVRTIFNLLGPLTNPAGAPRQLIGVADPAYLERMGRALAILGCERALIVHGRDGMDEVSTGAVSDVIAVQGPAVRASLIDPIALGFPPPEDGDIAGGDPAHNAAVLRAVLAGEPGPARDVVELNAAAAIWLAGAADTLEDALPLAVASIDEGAAAERLDAFVAITRSLAPAG